MNYTVLTNGLNLFGGYEKYGKNNISLSAASRIRVSLLLLHHISGFKNIILESIGNYCIIVKC